MLHFFKQVPISSDPRHTKGFTEIRTPRPVTPVCALRRAPSLALRWPGVRSMRDTAWGSNVQRPKPTDLLLLPHTMVAIKADSGFAMVMWLHMGHTSMKIKGSWPYNFHQVEPLKRQNWRTNMRLPHYPARRVVGGPPSQAAWRTGSWSPACPVVLSRHMSNLL